MQVINKSIYGKVKRAIRNLEWATFGSIYQGHNIDVCKNVVIRRQKKIIGLHPPPPPPLHKRQRESEEKADDDQD